MLSELQWHHLVILACSKTFVEKRIPENRMQNRIWNSCLDFISKEIWRLNHPNWTLWMTTSGKIFKVNHRYRPKKKISPNSRKCCKWQFNSKYDRQSCKRVFLMNECLCCSWRWTLLLFVLTAVLCCFITLAWRA